MTLEEQSKTHYRAGLLDDENRRGPWVIWQVGFSGRMVASEFGRFDFREAAEKALETIQAK